MLNIALLGFILIGIFYKMDSLQFKRLSTLLGVFFIIFSLFGIVQPLGLHQLRRNLGAATKPVLAGLFGTYMGGNTPNATAFFEGVAKTYNSSVALLDDLHLIQDDWILASLLSTCFSIFLAVGAGMLGRSEFCGKAGGNIVQSGDNETQVEVVNEASSTTTYAVEEVESLGKSTQTPELSAYAVSNTVRTLQWSTTALSGDVLTSVSIADVFPLPVVRRIFADYRFARFDVEYTVSVTGNAAASGTLIGVVRPSKPLFPIQQVYGSSVITSPLAMAFALPHSLMQASANAVYKFRLPFWHFREMFTSVTPASYGSLNLITVHPLVVPPGSVNNVTLVIAARVVNLVVSEPARMLAQVGERKIEIERGDYLGMLEEMFRNAALPRNVLGDSVGKRGKMRQGKPAVKGGDAFDHARTFTSVAGSVLETLSPAFKVARNVFGFDKPSDTRNPAVGGVSAYQKLLNATNVVDVTKASIDSSVMTTIDKDASEMLCIDGDEMSLDFFKNRYQHVTSFPVNPTAQIGALMFRTPLMPHISADATVTSGPSGIARMAAFWRGSLKYRILFPVNMFKQGRFVVTVQYGAGTGDLPGVLGPAQLDVLANHNLVFDINNPDGFIDIDIPYRSVFSMLRIIHSIPATTGEGQHEYSLGSLAMYLQTPITTSNVVSTGTHITVLRAWGADMEFSEYGAAPSYTTQAIESIGSASSLQTYLNNSAVITNLRQLLMVPATYHVADLNTNCVNNSPLTIPLYPGFMVKHPAWSFCLANFAGCSGSLRFVVRTTTEVKVAIFPMLDSVSGPERNANELSSLMSIVAAPSHDIFASARGRTVMPTAGNDSTVCGPGVSNVPLHHVLMTGLVGGVNPEKVFETPCTLGGYRTNPTTAVTNAAFGGGPGLLGHRNIPWMVIQKTVAANVSHIVSVDIMAGDDFRFFWYNASGTRATFDTWRTNGVALLAPDADAIVGWQ